MRVGLVNGCFDVLHVGHLKLFNFAKSHCDKLIVAIDSDVMVGMSKGKDRPFNNESDRCEMLINLKAVDETYVFYSHAELIDYCKQLKPDIHIVGSEYKDKYVVGGEHAKKLMFFDRHGDYSTSNIIGNNKNGD